MELQIQELVESIKRDGIAEAEKRAAEIVSEAQAKAEELVRNGAKEADKLVEDAKKEVAVLRQSGKAAVEQAARDVILSLKKSINAHFSRLLEAKIAETLSGDELVSLIVDVVKSDIASGDQVVEFSAEKTKKLAESLRSELAQELKDGLEIRPVSAVDVGFRLAAKDGSNYYDFSAEEITRMLSPFLNATVQEILSSSSDAQ